MEIRPERADDQLAVREVHLRAFGDHGLVVADLVDGLRSAMRPQIDLSLVAEEAGEVLGHVMLTHSWLDAPRELVDVQVLSPLSVCPDRHGQGIGGALVRRVLDTAAASGVPVVFLEGDPGYYSRLGFRAGAPLGFRRPSLRVPAVAFQAFLLPAHEPWMTGTLVYPEIFWRHDAVGLRDHEIDGDDQG